MTGRQIATAAEEDALPIGSVIVGSDSRFPWYRVANGPGGWARHGLPYPTSSQPGWPATVLHDPSAPIDTPAQDGPVEAREEAERRYPSDEGARTAQTVRAVMREAFAAGAEWQAERDAAEIERLRAYSDVDTQTAAAMASRAFAAEAEAARLRDIEVERDAARAELAALRQAVEALYRSVAVRGIKDGTTAVQMAEHVASELRAVLASHPAQQPAAAGDRQPKRPRPTPTPPWQPAAAGVSVTPEQIEAAAQALHRLHVEHALYPDAPWDAEDDEWRDRLRAWTRTVAAALGATVTDGGEAEDETPAWGPIARYFERMADGGESLRRPTSRARRRLRACVEAWPGCETGEYNPACCRFPKSCSADVYSDEHVTDADLEADGGEDR